MSKIGTKVPQVTFRTRVRDDSIDGPTIYLERCNHG